MNNPDVDIHSSIKKAPAVLASEGSVRGAAFLE